MRLPTYVAAVLSILFIISCSPDNKKKRLESLPSAKGSASDIVLVMDSTDWHGKVGDAIKATFEEGLFGVSRPVSMFNLIYIRPKDLNSVLRVQKNLIFCTLLNSNSSANKQLRSFFTKESLELIEKQPELFKYEKEDEFARGQKILHLFGDDPDELAQRIIDNKEQLQSIFDKAEEERTYEALYTAPPLKGISKVMEKELGCTLKVPYGYEIAEKGEDFIWIRLFGQRIDKNVFIYKKPYSSELMFEKDSLIKIRNEACRKYIYGDPENKGSYVVTETENYPVLKKDINFKGSYAAEMRGLWKTNNISMGGSFYSISTVDKNATSLYYVEGFIYAPDSNPRELIREIKVIVNTFNPITDQHL